MKTDKILYWASTGVFSLWMLRNCFGYLFSEEARVLCDHFGFPDYFRVELGIAKFIGVLFLLIPMRSVLKEWAYAGFVITVVSGIVAHLASGDPTYSALSGLIAITILMTSYFTFRRIQLLTSKYPSY